MRALLTASCLLLTLPVLGVLGSWVMFDAAALAVLVHQAQTVLPAYALQSGVLAAVVGAGVALLGAATAAAVTLFEFPGRRTFEWALLLPLAMPAYVLAYAWTDALQFSGPLQSTLRGWMGVQRPLWPDVRNLWAASLLFILCLYPYVYLLTRAALGERAVHMMEAARLLGADVRRRVLHVALPLARPALAAGTALALMETLADYGVGAYFGLDTFSTGIYKAWLVMNDRVAAAQLASILLAAVALLLALERGAQRRMRFATARAGGGAGSSEARPVALRGRAAWAAWLLCALPVALGFVLPVGWLMWMLMQEARYAEFGLPLSRFAEWSLASARLAALAAGAATLLALAPAVGGSRLRACAAVGGRDGPTARHRSCAAVRAAASAAAAPLGAGGGAAGLRGCHEGTARDAGAAPFRQRHAGGGGLQPGARRATQRSGAALAGHRRGGVDPGGDAVACAARGWRMTRRTRGAPSALRSSHPLHRSRTRR